MNNEPLQVALRVTQTLDELGVPYLIGGSLASTLYGEPRATMDADIIADLQQQHIEPFVRALTAEFYMDADSIREAIRNQRSFNLIHYATTFKVDVFVRKRRPFDDAQFARRKTEVLLRDPERTAQFASPEDSILAKLEWYRMGGEVSDRQWRDILGMLKTQGNRLDRAYLERTAEQLGVQDLLARAFQSVGE